MISSDQWRRFIDHPVVEWTIFALGAVLIILSPLAGVVPGPGGIFVFALGLAMVLKTSMWAKRRYVRFKRWQPKAGQWIDWGLRRRTAQRRKALAEAEAKAAQPDEAEAVPQSSPEPLQPAAPQPPSPGPAN